MSDFGRLRSYGYFLIPVHALCEPRYGTSWRVMYCAQLSGLSFALQALFLPPDSSTQLLTVQFPYHTWKIFKECGEGGVGGYSPGQCKMRESATTTCSKTLITYITVTVPVLDVQNSTVIVS